MSAIASYSLVERIATDGQFELVPCSQLRKGDVLANPFQGEPVVVAGINVGIAQNKPLEYRQWFGLCALPTQEVLCGANLCKLSSLEAQVVRGYFDIVSIITKTKGLVKADNIICRTISVDEWHVVVNAAKSRKIL